MKLGMLMVLAPDLGEARRFYGEVLGLRIGRIEAVLRGRAGAEGPRRAAEGCRPSCEPGRWRGHAASLGMPAQAALP